MDFFAIFISSFVIALSGAMMPGPLLTATIGESSQRGFLAGPLLIAGHGILELLLLAALGLGLAPFLRRDDVFVVVAIAGGFILLWMAIGMFRALPSLTLSLKTEGMKRGSLVWNGAVLSIANPYWIIWWATIGLGYLMYSWKYGLAGIAVFFAGHILADFAWYVTISAVIGKGRHLFSNKLYRGIIAVCAAGLVVFAGYFFYAGLQKLV